MYDQWVEPRPSLDIEDSGHGLFIQRIGPQSVNSLGGKRDESTGAQYCGGAKDLGLRGFLFGGTGHNFTSPGRGDID